MTFIPINDRVAGITSKTFASFQGSHTNYSSVDMPDEFAYVSDMDCDDEKLKLRSGHVKTDSGQTASVGSLFGVELGGLKLLASVVNGSLSLRPLTDVVALIMFLSMMLWADVSAGATLYVFPSNKPLNYKELNTNFALLNDESGQSTNWLFPRTNGLEYVLSRTDTWDLASTDSIDATNRLSFIESLTDGWETVSEWWIGSSNQWDSMTNWYAIYTNGLDYTLSRTGVWNQASVDATFSTNWIATNMVYVSSTNDAVTEALEQAALLYVPTNDADYLGAATGIVYGAQDGITKSGRIFTLGTNLFSGGSSGGGDVFAASNNVFTGSSNRFDGSVSVGVYYSVPYSVFVSPDVSGRYLPTGNLVNGKPSYYCSGHAATLYFNGSVWLLSIGETGAWYKSGTDPVGSYNVYDGDIVGHPSVASVDCFFSVATGNLAQASIDILDTDTLRVDGRDVVTTDETSVVIFREAPKTWGIESLPDDPEGGSISLESCELADSNGIAVLAWDRQQLFTYVGMDFCAMLDWSDISGLLVGTNINLGGNAITNGSGAFTGSLTLNGNAVLTNEADPAYSVWVTNSAAGSTNAILPDGTQVNIADMLGSGGGDTNEAIRIATNLAAEAAAELYLTNEVDPAYSVWATNSSARSTNAILPDGTLTNISHLLGGGGGGDFTADGSVPMTGDINLGGNAISNGAGAFLGSLTLDGNAVETNDVIPAFSVTMSGTQTNATASVYYDAQCSVERFDTRGIWNPATYRGTLGRTGVWSLSAVAHANNITVGQAAYVKMMVEEHAGSVTTVVASVKVMPHVSGSVIATLSSLYYCTNAADSVYFSLMATENARAWVGDSVPAFPSYFSGVWLGD